MSKKRFLWGTLILTCTGFLSRFIGFFYRIFLSHSIGAQGMGIYQLMVPLQTLAMAVTSSGIQFAISRFCASHIALGEEKRARDYFMVGTVMAVGISMAVAFLVFGNAEFFAVEILKEPRTYGMIRLLSFSFPLSTLHSCIGSYYFARKQTGIPSALQLMEQLVRVGAAYLLYLICISEGREVTPMIAAGGAVASEVASSLGSMLAIGVNFKKSGYSVQRISRVGECTRELFQLSLPHSLNRILVTLLGSMEVVLIPQRLRMAGLEAGDALGIYGVFAGMALPLILFPSAITNSASVMLMPSIAELQALGHQKRIRYVTGQVCRYCLLLGTGCALMFFFGGTFLGNFLFHNSTAGVFIRRMAFICPFLYLNTALASVLNGLGKSGICLLHNVAGLIIRICFVLFTIPVMGIQGYFCGILLSELLRSILHITELMRAPRKKI